MSSKCVYNRLAKNFAISALEDVQHQTRNQKKLLIIFQGCTLDYHTESRVKLSHIKNKNLSPRKQPCLMVH